MSAGRAEGPDGVGRGLLGLDDTALPGLEVRAARGEEDLAAVVALRRQVFGEEQGIADAFSPDPDDARSLHALAVLPTPDGERPISTGRLTLAAGTRGEAHVAWVATLPVYRGHGVGHAVMTFLLAAADAAGAPSVVLSAQTHALHFYGRLGFVPFGQRFLVRGIEHQLMVRAAGPGPAPDARGWGHRD